MINKEWEESEIRYLIYLIKGGDLLGLMIIEHSLAEIEEAGTSRNYNLFKYFANSDFFQSLVSFQQSTKVQQAGEKEAILVTIHLMLIIKIQMSYFTTRNWSSLR